MPKRILAKFLASAFVFGGIAYGSGTALSAARTPADDLLFSVNSRINPDYDPQGIRIEDLTISPFVSSGIRYTDNVYADDNNEVEDFIYTFRSGVGVKSDFVRHAIAAGLIAERGIYRKQSSENYTDYKAELSGRIDATGQTSIPLSFSYARDHYNRNTPDDLIGVEPTQFDLWEGATGIVHKGRRLAMKMLATIRDYIFEDNRTGTGALIDNSGRDRTEWTLYSSIGLPEEGYFAPFLYNELVKINYDSNAGPGGLNRDSHGYEIGAGSIVNFSQVTKATFTAGYVKRQYDHAALSDVGDFTYGMNILWEPSPLAAFTLSAKRTVEETVFAGSQGSLRDNLALSMNYELFPNLFLKPNAGYEVRDYEGIDREIERLTGGIDMTYKMNRNIWLTGAYSYITQEEDGSFAGQNDFESNNFNLSLKLQF